MLGGWGTLSADSYQNVFGMHMGGCIPSLVVNLSQMDERQSTKEATHSTPLSQRHHAFCQVVYLDSHTLRGSQQAYLGLELTLGSTPESRILQVTSAKLTNMRVWSIAELLHTFTASVSCALYSQRFSLDIFGSGIDPWKHP